jgi:hypothetical protein
MSRHKIIIDGVETVVVVVHNQEGTYDRVRVHALNPKGQPVSEHMVPPSLLRSERLKVKCRTGGHTYESGGGS